MTFQELDSLLEYREGSLYWRVSRGRMAKQGAVAGCIKRAARPYWRTKVKGKLYYTHRLIYWLVHGEQPAVVDHIDGNTLNNDVANLRACDRAGNTQNAKKRTDNTSGVKGVSWSKQHANWTARISVNKRAIFLGRFKTLDEAEKVVRKAREIYHAAFARHN